MSFDSIRVSLCERSYDIIIGENTFISGQELKGLLSHVSGRSCFLISDENVHKLYSDVIETLLIELDAHFLGSCFFKAGEQSKTIETVEHLFKKLIGAGLDRKSIIIALGGGVVGDTVGFAASTYMRGIDYIQIPTSLVAQVDSSVGGKTGVDLAEGKNLVGSFYQPKSVIIDTTVLSTLPERELQCGMAEVIKYGVILDADFFQYLEENVDGIRNIDQGVFAAIVHKCCSLKAHVVANDELDTGLRAILNYGHTFGHALEKLTGYRELTHGEAIAIGMGMAADLAVLLDKNSKTLELVERQDNLFKAIGLPVQFDRFSPDDILSAMYTDKKFIEGKLHLIIPERIGKVNVTSDTDQSLILEAIGARLD